MLIQFRECHPLKGSKEHHQTSKNFLVLENILCWISVISTIWTSDAQHFQHFLQHLKPSKQHQKKYLSINRNRNVSKPGVQSRNSSKKIFTHTHKNKNKHQKQEKLS